MTNIRTSITALLGFARRASCRQRFACIPLMMLLAMGSSQRHLQAQLSGSSGATALTTTGSGPQQITTTPLTISSAGTYYLTRDVVVIGDMCDAVDILASNVTLDLNGHTISTSPAGGPYNSNGTHYGIYALDRSSITVQDGSINGFLAAVYMAASTNSGVYDDSKSYGHVISNLKLMANTSVGVWLEGGDSIVRDCQIMNTGGSTNQGSSYGVLFYGPRNEVSNCNISKILSNVSSSGPTDPGTGLADPSYGVDFAQNAIDSFATGNRVSDASYGIFLDTSTGSGKFEANTAAADVLNPYTGGTDAGGNKSSPTSATFSFSLAADYYTSGGVYDNSGNLVKTLWRKIRYLAGAHAATWDGTDDYGRPVAAGNYIVKVLRHNINYAWDGVIGNTSSSFTNQVYRCTTAQNLTDLANDGSGYIYVAYGYTEGNNDVLRFSTATPQTPQYVTPPEQAVAFGLVATDGIWVYVANTGSGFDPNLQTFVTAYSYNNNSFSNVAFSPAYQQTVAFPPLGPSYNCIDLRPAVNGLFQSPTGLAVQNGTGAVILAVAHGDFDQGSTHVQGLGKVFLYHKTTGKPIGFISIVNPQRIAFAPNGDLWIVSIASSGAQPGSVVRIPASSFANLPQNGNAQTQVSVPSNPTTISGLLKPLALAINALGDRVLVADGGNAFVKAPPPSEQVKMFSASDGAFVSAYGQPGGYTTNGSIVTSDKFQFGAHVGLTALSDSSGPSFWIGDGGCGVGGTNRLLHFTFGASPILIEQIACLSDNETVAVDYNDPSRVFWDYLEFRLDYTKPLVPGPPTNQSWTLVRNWAAGLSSLSNSGLDTVVELNGRVFGLVDIGYPYHELYELPSGNFPLIDTMLPPLTSYYDRYSAFSLYGNGDLRYSTVSESGNPANPSSSWTQSFYRKPLLSTFDSNNNPQWDSPVLLGTANYQVNNPLTQHGDSGHSSWQVPVTKSQNIIVFDSSLLTGWHLGGIAPHGTQFQWRASPTLSDDSPFDGLGSYDIGNGVLNAGDKVVAQDDQIIYGYHGENWDGQQANQFMHYFSDGLFIGQFGTPGTVQSPLTYLPGGAGNATCPTIISNGADTYYYTNDDSAHSGIHRWHIVGFNALDELSASITTGGSSIPTLHGQTLTYPSDLQAIASNGSVTLNWTPVAGASSYKVKWVMGNPVANNPTWPTGEGGPYPNVRTVSTPSCTISSLVNDNRYYFVVTSVDSQSVESTPSYEVHATPFDVSKPVHLIGQLAKSDLTGGLINVASNFSSQGRPSVQLQPMDDILGTLQSIDFGSRGYYVFDFFPSNGTKQSVSTFPSNYTVSIDSHWTDSDFIGNTISIDGQPSRSCILVNNGQLPTSASVSVTVPDTAWHCLTVVSPATFADKRYVTITLASHANPQYSASLDFIGCSLKR